ncbi:MAG TPA: arginine deiminase-related protein [Terriglobia bacterium]|nr:arginine deiminase-related protein [Terriglobia bacterium]
MTQQAQLPIAIVMVRPASFGFNPETASTILFQREPTETSRRDIERRARIEFDMLAGRLGEAGVEIILVEDVEELHTPDAVFPNNWVSFHHDGTVVLYPMLAPSRRPERRRDIIEKLQSGGFRVSNTVDLTHHENHGRFLEGTGSVVFDHVARRAYASISPRTSPDVLNELCGILGYKPLTFRAVQENGNGVLHTDMTMSIGDRFVIFCPDSIPDAAERKLVVDSLRAADREIITIDRKQVAQFAANVLQVQSGAGRSVLAISTSAWLIFRADQREAIQRYAQIVESPLPLFERIGGGSARCMMVDVHLPRR